MQIIFLLLGLFALGCVLYGISSGVQIIVRGFARLTKGTRNSAPPIKTSPVSLSAATLKTANESVPMQQDQKPETSAMGVSSIQRSIDELREIFSLYQQGALTQEEFEGLKKCLLFNIQSDAL